MCSDAMCFTVFLSGEPMVPEVVVVPEEVRFIVDGEGKYLLLGVLAV